MRARIDIGDHDLETLHMLSQDPEGGSTRLHHEHIAAGESRGFRDEGLRIAIRVQQKDPLFFHVSYPGSE